MTIEENILKKTEPNYEKLLKYGFKKEHDKYTYKTTIMNDEFEVEITVKEKLEGKVIDLNTEEEYTNIRLENIGAYTSKVKEEYEKVLIDIKNRCFEKNYFMFPQSNRITEYIINKYKAEPEFLWKKLDGSAVFRNKNNKKWFGIIMDINKNKIDKENKIAEIINLKIEEKDKEKLLKINGFYEAYHMNKNKWISIILDDTVFDEEIIKLIDKSYNLINN